MTRLQLIIIAATTLLFLVLYFGCETKPDNIAALEKTRALSAETTNVQNLIMDAQASLSPADKASIDGLEQLIAGTEQEEEKVANWKLLSGKWYELGHPSISGHYAQKVAEVDESEKSWSIAGTTYTICLQQKPTDKVKSFCMDRAVAAFENAISINPENSAHKVNLALAYAENPPADNPMQGIQLLLGLNKENPEDVLVLTTLARLGLRTGQFEKASQRLEKVISIEPDHLAANCLLAQAYEQLGEAAKAR